MSTNNQPSVQRPRRPRRGKKRTGIPPAKLGPKRPAVTIAEREKKKAVEVIPVKTGDPRIRGAAADAKSVQNEKKVISQVIPIDPNTFCYVIASWISIAVAKGFYANSNSPLDAFFAYTYAVQMLNAAALGVVPQVQAVPYWLLCYMHAISPKSVHMDLGEVSYSFEGVSTSFAPAPDVPGTSSVSGQFFFLIPALTAVDGFPIGTLASGYTPDAGENAYSELCTFFSGWYAPGDGRSKMNMMVPISTSTPFKQNVSAFAIQMNPAGSGSVQTGGWGTVLGLEVPILTPLFSCIGSTDTYNGATSLSRYPRFSHPFAGDLGQVAPLMCQWSSSKKHWNFKRPPKYHWVDFNEFGDVLANYVVALQTAYFQQAAATVSPITADQIICPLSLQEVLLVLRNEILYALGGGNECGQFVAPMISQTPSQNAFVPYLMGTNSCPMAYAGMNLPTPLVENVKSLTMRFAPRKGNDFEWFISVLGQYKSDVLLQSDYQYNQVIGEVETLMPSFTTISDFRKRKMRDSKKNSVWVPEIEVPISFIDGTSGTNYVFINDPPRLQELAALWNQWLARFSQFSSELGVVSNEYGINVLCSASTTLHWVTISSSTIAREEEVLDTRVKRVRTSSVYANRQVAAITQKGTFLAGPTETVISQWILPVNQVVSWNNQTQTAFTRIQDLLAEPYIYAQTSTGDNGINLASRHVSYANQMVHGLAAQPTVWDKFFASMANAGRGGILSSLVASLAGKALGPEIGGVASTVANLLPF